jgi:hypothetical protein
MNVELEEEKRIQEMTMILHNDYREITFRIAERQREVERIRLLRSPDAAASSSGLRAWFAARLARVPAAPAHAHPPAHTNPPGRGVRADCSSGVGAT